MAANIIDDSHLEKTQEMFAKCQEVISGGECFSIAQLAVTGDDLIAMGIAPSRQLGAILNKLLDHVIDHPEDNKREVLMKRAQKP